MCGIFGIFSKNNKFNIGNITDSSLKLMKHRGPDYSKKILTKNFCCGVNRLAIEALKYGEQPVQDDRYIFGFNGEIFNYRKIANDLNIKNIKSEIDLILKLWRLKGVNFVKYIQGQYALFIYDKVKEEIYLFRDAFGIRPLFFFKQNENFVFSSEIKGIINTKLLTPEINSNSLMQNCYFWTNVDKQTSFKNIYSLPPGSFLKWNIKEFKIQKHFNFSDYSDETTNNFDISHELENAIERQVPKEVKYGCYLSGGIDSSILAKILSKKTELNTFSISFDNKEYNEDPFQKLFLNENQTNHYQLKVTDKMIANNFEKTVNHAETFIFRTAPVPMYLLSNLVKKQGIKVIFSGEGADEILFGYDIFFENRIRNFWKKKASSKLRPQLLKKLYNYLPQFSNSRYFEMTKDFYKSTLNKKSDYYSHLVRWSQFDHVSSFFKFKDNFNKNFFHKELSKSLPVNFGSLSEDQKTQNIEINTLLSNYLLSSQGDRMTMANSVEGRYPYLDEKFVKQASKFGSKNLAPKLVSKEYLRESFKDILPKKIVNRPKTAYQAPEAKSFVNNRYTSKIVEEFIDNINHLDLIDKKNFLNLIDKLRDPLSSKRIGFRENMAFILGLSYFTLNKSMIRWYNND